MTTGTGIPLNKMDTVVCAWQAARWAGKAPALVLGGGGGRGLTTWADPEEKQSQTGISGGLQPKGFSEKKKRDV